LVGPAQPAAPVAVHYLDSSALVKRYAVERGTGWVRALCDDASNAVVMAHIGLVEIAAALASKQRGGHLASTQYEQLLAELMLDAQSQYVLVRVTESIVEEAVDLTRRHRLRGYDAIHLACALSVNRALLDRHQSPLDLVAADDDLLGAAQDSGLATENPNAHP
jgi:predicted nucleic acid-binding protein